MKDVFTGGLCGGPDFNYVCDEVAQDLLRLSVMLRGINALASGATAFEDGGDPMEQIEAASSLMVSRVEVMRARVERNGHRLARYMSGGLQACPFCRSEH